jgi:hypothetical protein
MREIWVIREVRCVTNVLFSWRNASRCVTWLNIMMIRFTYYLYYEEFVGTAPRIKIICSYDFLQGGVLNDLATTLKSEKRLLHKVRSHKSYSKSHIIGINHKRWQGKEYVFWAANNFEIQVRKWIICIRRKKQEH